MVGLSEKIKDSYFYKEDVAPVLSSVENIKDEEVKRSIKNITDKFNENTSKEELVSYMEQIDKILIKYEVQGGLVSTSSEFERSQITNKITPTPEEQKSFSGFKGLVSPETGEIYAGVVAAGAGIVDKYITEPVKVGVETYENEKEKGLNIGLKGDEKNDEKNDKKSLESNEETNLEKYNDLYSELNSLDFNGEYSYEELLQRIEGLKNKINSGEIGKFLTKEQKEIFIKNIENGLEEYKEQESISLGVIETHFEEMANSIVEKNGKFYLQMESEGQFYEKEFSSKEAALQEIKSMKYKSEIELQNFGRTMLEGFGNGVINSIGFVFGKVLKPSVGKAYELVWEGEKILLNYSANSWKDIFGNLDDKDNFDFAEGFHLFTSSILTLASISLLVGFHTAVGTSIKRRVFNDFLMGKEQSENNSRYVYEDYFLTGKNTNPFQVGTPEYSDYDNFKQRQTIIEGLKLKRDSYPMGSDEYLKYDKILNKLDKYRLNKTPTFEFLVDKLITNDGKSLGQLSSSMKTLFYREGFYLFWPKSINPKKLLTTEGWDGTRNIKKGTLISNGINKIDEWNSEIGEKSEEFYGKKIKVGTSDDSFKFKMDFEDGLEVKVEDLYKGKYYNGIVNHIKDLPDLSENDKLERIENIRKYFESIALRPKSIENIKIDLYRISEGYVSNDYAIGEIDKKIDEIEKSAGGLFDKKTYSGMHIFKLYGGEIAKLKYLREAISENKFIFTSDELENIIKNPTYKISNEYLFSKRIKVEDVLKEFDKLASNLDPNSGILEKGEKISKNIDEIKNKYGNTLDELKTKTDELRGISNYIDFKLESSNEQKFRGELDEFLKNFLEGKTTVTSEAEFLDRIKLITDNFLVVSDNLKEFKDYKNLKGVDDIEKFITDNFKNQIDNFYLLTLFRKLDSATNDDDLKSINLDLEKENYAKIIDYVNQNKVTAGQLTHIFNDFISGTISFTPEKKINSDYLNVRIHNKVGLSQDIFNKNNIRESFEKLNGENETYKQFFLDLLDTNNITPENFKNEINNLNPSSNSGASNSPETGKTTEELIEKFNEVKSVLERAELELLLKNKFIDSKAKISEIRKEFNDKEFLEKIINVEEYIKNELNLSEIREISEFKDLFKGQKYLYKSDVTIRFKEDNFKFDEIIGKLKSGDLRIKL